VLTLVLVVLLLEAVADAVVGGLVVTRAISIAILMGMITMAMIMMIPISPTMTPVAGIRVRVDCVAR
jgi:hypothetical protein